MEYLEANGTYLSRSSVRTHPPLRGPLPRGDRLRSNNFHEVPSLEGCPKGGVGGPFIIYVDSRPFAVQSSR